MMAKALECPACGATHRLDGLDRSVVGIELLGPSTDVDRLALSGPVERSHQRRQKRSHAVQVGPVRRHEDHRHGDAVRGGDEVRVVSPKTDLPVIANKPAQARQEHHIRSELMRNQLVSGAQQRGQAEVAAPVAPEHHPPELGGSQPGQAVEAVHREPVLHLGRDRARRPAANAGGAGEASVVAAGVEKRGDGLVVLRVMDQTAVVVDRPHAAPELLDVHRIAKAEYGVARLLVICDLDRGDRIGEVRSA